MLRRLHLFYSGRVQGVGFRFTAYDISRSLGVRGWARNLGDGRVEVIAEAEDKVLKEFLSRIESRFGNYIAHLEQDWQEPSSEFKDFRIRF